MPTSKGMQNKSLGKCLRHYLKPCQSAVHRLGDRQPQCQLAVLLRSSTSLSIWSCNCSWTGRSSTSKSTRCPTETVSHKVNLLSNTHGLSDCQPSTSTHGPVVIANVNVNSLSCQDRSGQHLQSEDVCQPKTPNVDSLFFEDRSGQYLQPKGDRQPKTPNVNSLLCQKSTHASILIGDPAVYWQPISNDEVTRATRSYPLILLHLNY